MSVFAPWDHLLAGLLLVGLPLIGWLQRARAGAPWVADPYTSHDKLLLYWSNSLLLALMAGAALLVWTLGGRDLAQLGLAAPPRQLAAGAALALAFLLAYGADTWRQLGTPERLAATRARWRRDTPFMPRTAREVRHSLVLVVAAAVCEEILYRGFLVAYVAAFTGPTRTGLAAAVAIPALVFGICHLYQGVQAALKIVALSCLFGALLVVTGSLWIPIVLHFVVDLIGVLLSPTLLAEEASQPG